jgi:hypothetical protein
MVAYNIAQTAVVRINALQRVVDRYNNTEDLLGKRNLSFASSGPRAMKREINTIRGDVFAQSVDFRYISPSPAIFYLRRSHGENVTQRRRVGR